MFRVYGVTCVLMLAAFGAQATTIVLPTDAQLVEKSPVIVEGQVLSTAPFDRNGAIWTETTVRVARAIKGEADTTLTIREPGGMLGERFTKIYGAPEFTAGEDVLLFLDPEANGSYRVVDLFVGSFEKATTTAGQELWTRDDTVADVNLLDANFQRVESANVQRDAARFTQFIAERVAGRAGSANYGVENPILASSGSGKTRFQSNFELIDEPTVYRWFRFDNGSSATWFSSGTQPGYTDGGISEMHTAMGSWTNYPQARILYTYSGVRTGSLGGLDNANGVNEILFNDPLGEISGSWNRSAGGVVGTGGFNGVTNGGTFNATFAADAKHPAGPIRAYAITEGNLTIQDNVSAANGISSLVLAEILAHEFGHTLGFGHSADSSALMYATVTRTGPALRADDEVAARWLYPNGTTTTPPTTPATPAVVAAFDASPSVVELGAPVSFADRSSGSPTSWSWSFGDGATAKVQNPTHAYSSPGTYTVTLTAAKTGSSSIATKSVTVVASASYSSLVSVAAQTGGVGGTSWRTELSLFNAGSQGASVSLLFLPTGGGNVTARSLFLSPNQSRTYANALLDIFGIASGAGALAIEAGGAGTIADLRVTSRTFTTGPGGTYGQSVPDISSDDLVKTLYIAGIESTPSYRTNIGLVNRGPAPVSATLTLLDASGSAIATRGVTLAANSFQQQAVGAWFPAVNGQTREHLTMRLVAAEATVSAYGSVVDNLTQDPVYLQAVPASAGSSLTIPVVGRSPGANGTFWRSDVTLFNPASSRVTLSLVFGNVSKSLSINAGDTLVLADVLSTWGQTSGSGTLRVTWSGSVGPVVTSRTYTSTAAGGTYGQSIDPVASFATRMSVPGLRNDSGYRSNVGFVNGGTGAESFTVRVLSQSGTELGRTTLTLNAGAQTQYPVAALFPGLNANPFTLQIEGDGDARLFAYGSMVDNLSGDPVFFAGR